MCMAAIHIRDLDDDVQRRLVEQADAEGVSFSEWVRSALTARARVPSAAEFNRLASERRAKGEAMTWSEFDEFMASISRRGSR